MTDSIDAAIASAAEMQRRAAIASGTARRLAMCQISTEHARREWLGASKVASALETAQRYRPDAPLPDWARMALEARHGDLWDGYTDAQAREARALAVYTAALTGAPVIPVIPGEMGTGNVHDDDEETLQFAEEGPE